MKPAGIVGIILIVVGIIAFAYGGFTYTTRGKVIYAGPLQVSAGKEHQVPFSPVLGGICLVGGIVLVIVGGRRDLLLNRHWFLILTMFCSACLRGRVRGRYCC